MAKRMFILLHRTWKEKIRSIILDWRQRSAGHSSARGDLLVSQPKGETRSSLKQTFQLPVCVLRPSHYFTKRVLAIEEIYARTLSDYIPTTHNRRRRRIKIQIVFLYIYESFIVCLAVRYMRHVFIVRSYFFVWLCFKIFFAHCPIEYE